MSQPTDIYREVMQIIAENCVMVPFRKVGRPYKLRRKVADHLGMNVKLVDRQRLH
jgi:hypothetical protein